MVLRRLAIMAITALALLAFGTTGSFAQEAVTVETVKVLHPVDYVVVRGDNLTSLAGRFGVSMEAILEMNPKVANRTKVRTRHWLYRGERLTIPTYITEEKTVNNVGDNAMVVTTMKKLRALETAKQDLATALVEKNMALDREYALERAYEGVLAEKTKFEELVKSNDKTIFWIVLGSASAFLSLLAFMAWLLKLEGRPLDAKELREVLATTKGEHLLKLVDEALFYDDKGNPANIKNLKDFVEKRPGLREKLLNSTPNQWQEILSQQSHAGTCCGKHESRQKETEPAKKSGIDEVAL